MEWIEASERLPKEKGSYYCYDKTLSRKVVLWFNCKNTRSHLKHQPKRYRWLDEDYNRYEHLEKQVIDLLSISGCSNVIEVRNYFKKIKR